MKNQHNKRLHIILREFTLTDVLIYFDAISLYPSAMWDEQPVYPKIETGYAFTPVKK